MQNNIGIFIFRKDLRLDDNIGLINLSKKCKIIYPIFILDEYQIELQNHNQYYYSNNAVQFMCESLIDLNYQLSNKLNLFKGEYISVLENIFKHIKLGNNNIILGYNRDYTQYALKRDGYTKNLAIKYKIEVMDEENDLSLISFDKMIKTDKTAYTVFGAFYKNAIKTHVKNPIKNNFKKYMLLKNIRYNYKIRDLKYLYEFNKNLAQEGGRNISLRKIKNKHVYENYKTKRDMLDFNTYQISASLNFGCISIREMYFIIKHNAEIKKQLYWRDYYLCILRYIPNANSYTKFIDERYNNLNWSNSNKNWKLLMDSKTGFLIVDAAMRELQKTGYIGNRIRLILGTFWIKYLLISPFHKEYGSQTGFSRFLVDCNTSQNKLNHQWLLELDLNGRRFAKRGCSSLSGRMMRVDNEMIKKFDNECNYIKKWMPELKNIPNKDLYKWNEEIQKKYNVHVAPIFDWEVQYKKYCKLF
jgi:deoxyribodipyrimidine photo-lyase